MNATECSEKHFETCWTTPSKPLPELLAALKDGPFDRADSIGEIVARLRREKVSSPVFFVGAGTCGLGAGAGKTLEVLRKHCAQKKIDAQIVEVGCLGLCYEEPLVDVQLPGKARLSFGRVTADKITDLVDKLLCGELSEELLIGQHSAGGLEIWPGVPLLEDHPFLRAQKRLVLALSGLIDPCRIDEYIACGGYSALFETLNHKTPRDVAEEILKSGLRGRGGGGFPTGKKWLLAAAEEANQKYLICNADEGDPGAFMDRAVGESDPHRLIEGMLIAAYAIGATKAYIYIRAEYPLAVRNLRIAIEQARRYGLLGTNILDSGFDLEVKIKMGAGAFVCGEETALMHSIEGKRGMPRPRPPYPIQSGLFGKPTVINNVETLSAVPAIMANGWQRFADLGTEGSKGTKVFALSGMVRRTGLVEVPMGTTLSEVVFKIGGGVIGGRRCKAVQIGGPSGGCIPAEHLEIPCDYEALKQFGAIMGSGGLVVLDEHTCMVDLAKFFMEFIQTESCGKCIPCREGTRRMLEILQAITRPRHKESDIDALLRFQGVMYLHELGEIIKKTSLCGLGQTAPNPVLSTLKWFRDEYEAHIYDRNCPAGACKELVGAPCQNGCPVGTEVWRYVAHVGRGEFDEAYRVIRAANPFPSVCARVCNHPCESFCRAGTTGGEPIAVRALKRFVVDRVKPQSMPMEIKAARRNAPKVAVIGGGPAGLTAAHYLSREGYPVTIFEKEAEPGGMLLAGIPEYRLPRDRIAHEIQSLLNENTQLLCEKTLGEDFTVEQLLRTGYQAVYISIGAHKSKRLNIAGEDAAGVVQGIEFLKSYNLHGEKRARGKVGVIGGGNSAIDAARVAIRQPNIESVTIFYRRSRDEMPAYAEEIDAAVEEGVKLVELFQPVKVGTTNGALRYVTFVRNELGQPDESGRRRPMPIENSEREIELDTLVVAIGEEPNVEALDTLRASSRNTLVINEESCSAGRPGVFGGGDVVTGPNTVIDAVAAGKRAALMIDRYLTGKQLRLLPKVKLPSVYIEPVSGDETDDGAARIAPVYLPPQSRVGNFKEVELCVSEKDAVCEARRCLRCDIEFTQPA